MNYPLLTPLLLPRLSLGTWIIMQCQCIFEMNNGCFFFNFYAPYSFKGSINGKKYLKVPVL